jgi:hypothetical protein
MVVMADPAHNSYWFSPTIKSIKHFLDSLIEFYGFWEPTGVLQMFPIDFLKPTRVIIIPIGFLKTFIDGC